MAAPPEIPEGAVWKLFATNYRKHSSSLIQNGYYSAEVLTPLLVLSNKKARHRASQVMGELNV